MNSARIYLFSFLRPAVLAWTLIAQPALVQAAPVAEVAEAAQVTAHDRDFPLEGMLSRYSESMHKLLDNALGLVGIRYRRGGSDAESGFDCSGFVGHVFLEQLGLKLPRTSGEMSKTGEQVTRADLQPGDLVFFNTMRRAFSHVGIYLGNGQFVHAPRPGKSVRVEDIDTSYWARRYNGARRVSGE